MAVAAWVVGLGTVVVIALLGAASPSDSRPVPTAAAIASVKPRATTERSIRIDQPAQRDEVVRTREIVVRGQVREGVSQVWITLESGGRPIATGSLDPTGMPRNNLIPFETRFTVDRPRPAGPLFVMVVAIDADGVPIDAMRRRFMLGEWLDLRGQVRNTSRND